MAHTLGVDIVKLIYRDGVDVELQTIADPLANFSACLAGYDRHVPFRISEELLPECHIEIPGDQRRLCLR